MSFHDRKPLELSDDQILRKFRETRCESAFQTLVERYLGMVHGVATRLTGDPELAKEVAQDVFTIFARKADKLSPRTVIGGWLHRAATYGAAEALRRKYRYKKTMQTFTEFVEDQQSGTNPLSEILPNLDKAISKLRQSEQDAILLRFQCRLSFREIGHRLGKSEEASQKQVRRAVEKLGLLLGKGGKTVSQTALVAGLSGILCNSIPAGMAETIAKNAICANAPASFSLPFLMGLGQAKTRVLVGGSVWLFLSGVSFWAGRDAATTFGHSPGLPLAQPPHLQVASTVATDAEVAVRSRDGQDPQDEVRSILDEAAGIYLGPGDRLTKHYAVALVLHRLQPEDLNDALNYIRTLPKESALQDQMAPIVLGICAETDGEAVRDR